MRRALATTAAALAVAGLATPAYAATPATSEWTWWIGMSGGSRHFIDDDYAIFQGSAGAEVTFGLTTFTGGGEHGNGGDWEFRWGPWLGTSFGPREFLGETGLKIHFSQVSHANWGTFEIRTGGGYGFVEGIQAPHFVLTAAGGVRSFLQRYKDNEEKAVGFGSVLRAFGTVRAWPTLPSAFDIVFGLELQPEILGPPYSWPRIAGDQP